MNKHTPGPWRVSETLPHGSNVRGAHGVQVAWCGTNSTYGRNGGHYITDDEAANNARLIAAAPELLAAAQNALHYMRLHKYADKAWADDLEAVIAKATGEQP